MVVVDVGNTRINFFCFKNKRIAKKAALLTDKVSKAKISAILANFPAGPILLCSVVPGINKLFRFSKRKVYLVGKNIKVPIKCYYNKRQVGSDRLVAAFAAKSLFPKVRIILDFGTAITLDFLSKKGDYLGGIILPGVGSTLSVFSDCALLPQRIKLLGSQRLIPKNTTESISRGIREGFPEMINGLIRKYRRKLKINLSGTIVLTGGEASCVKSSLNFPYRYEPFLVAKGLNLLAAESNRFLKTKK